MSNTIAVLKLYRSLLKEASGLNLPYYRFNSTRNVSTGLKKGRNDVSERMFNKTEDSSRMFRRETSTSGQSSSMGYRKILGEKFGYYSASVAIAMFGVSFAAVPLYRIYCQATGKGGQAVVDDDTNKIVNLNVDKSRSITVRFDANTHSSTDWKFSPVQNKVIVHPGETALAFYRVKNPLDEPVIGVATYTVLPYEAGIYFNKIQCFCFEEQLLKPHEDVFMPVLFYIDPEYSKDPQLGAINDVLLSYTFFRSKDGEILELDEPIELKKHNR